MKAGLIILLVVVGLVGLLFTLRASRNLGMPKADVLDRARTRAREQAAAEREDEK
jgi:hypothetical protein